MTRSHLILPIFTPPSHFETRRAEILGQPNPVVVRYVGVLLDILDRRIAETGDLDYALADKIESFLFPHAQNSQKEST